MTTTSEPQHDSFLGSVLMPPDYLVGVAKRATLYMFLISVLQLGCLAFVKRWTGSSGGGGGESSSQTRTRNRLGKKIDVNLVNSFQLTNLIINLGLGLYGTYWWFLVLPDGCPPSDRIGHPYEMTPECLTPAFFSEFQMSYQLWSIPLCIIVGEDSLPMLTHHTFVSILAIMCSTLITSTRYYCVYYFGVVESSSVFLSIMNAFRSRPKWIDAMPTLFAVTKVLFSVTFLLTRIILWIPALVDFFTIAWDIGTSREPQAVYHFLIVMSFTPAFGLTAMQIYWAGKIVRGLFKMLSAPTDSEWHSGMSSHPSEDVDKKEE